MKKKFLFKAALILLAIMLVVLIIVAIVRSNRGYIIKDGLINATPKTEEKMDKLLAKKDDNMLIDLSLIDSRTGITIDDKAKRELLIIDGVGNSFNDLTIVTNAKKLCIRNITIINTSSPVLNTVATSVELSSTYFATKENGATCVQLEASSCELSIEYSATIYGGNANQAEDGGSAIFANRLSITTKNTKSAVLYLYGGKAGKGIDGNDGAPVMDYDISTHYASFSSGRNGTNGRNGNPGSKGISSGIGGDALLCQGLSVSKKMYIYAYGGDSNVSGSGGNGSDGGNGEGAYTPNPIRFVSYVGGLGGNGSRGGNGADEKRPGVGINCASAEISAESTVKTYAGKRGSAGKGGMGGQGGVGGFSSESSITNNSAPTQSPSGSKGANGKDGNTLQESEIKSYIISSLNGKIN